ncbi:Xanthine phosphoribosyltransferase [Gracilariopsis chorda]|uniref:Xanthine phosphoribosyltransferase n=1 Tax=Gracilariopsis chorda TaxID=448386 RepID=A0A2V3IEU5_9FLOR|nr:Xanthine phosphoribosyltransferase [Gracilariopsis chorda]|eukprot:PXF40583.1 Xanthine phosphoribosyltransferase [Gracilariopsis chorda]
MKPCFTTSVAPSLRFSARVLSTAHAPRRWTSKKNVRMFPKAMAPANGAISTTSRRYEGVSWSAVEALCNDIFQKAKNQNFDVILAVSRGGLVPAVLLCEAFELRNILSATVIFYADNGEQFFGMTEPRFLAFPSADALEGRRVLVVDDVWDSGRTAQAVRSRVLRAKPKDVKVAVLHYKPDRNIFPGEEPDFFSAITTNWVVYPWERPSPKTPQVGLDSADSSVKQGSADTTSTSVA